MNENKYSAQLREAILRWSENQTDENYTRVCETIVDACLAGDRWWVLLPMVNSEEMVYTPKNRKGMEQIKLTEETVDGEKYEVLFAMTEEETNKIFQNEVCELFHQMGTMAYSTVSTNPLCEEVLQTFAEAPKKIKDLWINPDSDVFFTLSKEMAQKILANVQYLREHPEEAEEEEEISLENKVAKLNSSLILPEKQYRALLTKICHSVGSYSEWSLTHTQLNADGTLTLCFNDSEIPDHYIAIVYDIHGKKARRVYDDYFGMPTLENETDKGKLRKILYDGKGFYAIVSDKADGGFYVGKVGEKYLLFPDGCRDAVMNADGKVCFALKSLDACEDGSKGTVTVGTMEKEEITYTTDNKDVRFCSALSLTPAGWLAFHNTPSDTIAIAGEGGYDTYKVSVTDIDAMAFSSDMGILFTASVQDAKTFSLTLSVEDENGDYTHSLPVVSYADTPLPDRETASVWGNPVMSGTTFVLNFGGDLYIYDTDTCVRVEDKE